jgi:Holliday junction resolvase RusA-like endonuclease
MTFELVLWGHVQAKKNNWRPMRGRIVPLSQPAVEPLIAQARAQWPHEPLDRACVRIRFYVPSRRGDLDNKLTTILDVLCSAGVLRNDNIASIPLISASAVIQPKLDEYCRIRLRTL